MNMTSRMLGVAVVLCGMMAVGCEQPLVVRLTFVNHTANVEPVTLTTPVSGTVNIGQVGANHSELPYTVQIPPELLPADCSVSVGRATKGFRLNQYSGGQLWFHLDEKGLAGPMDQYTEYRTTKQTGTIKTSGGTRTIID